MARRLPELFVFQEKQLLRMGKRDRPPRDTMGPEPGFFQPKGSTHAANG